MIHVRTNAMIEGIVISAAIKVPLSAICLIESLDCLSSDNS